MNSNRLALCLIVRDEAQWLPGCLESVRDLVDEIIIADTGSTDDTVGIAKSFGAKVFSYPWQNDFSAPRNAVLEKAHTDWILHLDADERWAGPPRTEIEPILSATTAEAFIIRVRNLHPAGDPVHYLDSPQIRLFRNRPAYRYRNPIHEQIEPSIRAGGGLIVQSNWLIRHEGYRIHPERKAERNLTQMENAVRNDPNNYYLRLKLGETYKALGRAAEALQVLSILESEMPGKADEILYLRLAQLYLAADNYQEAFTYARQGLDRSPDHLVLLFVFGVAGLYLQQVDLSRAALQKILTTDTAGLFDTVFVRQLLSAAEQLQK